MSINDRVFIRVYLGSDLIEMFQSGESQIVIGSEGDAHLKLDGGGVSAVHAMIEKRQDGFFVCDLGSASGTFKSGKQVLDDKINSGEELQIGDYRLEFFIGLPKPVAAKVTEPVKPKIQEVAMPTAPKLEDRLVSEETKVSTAKVSTPPSPTEKPLFKDVSQPSAKPGNTPNDVEIKNTEPTKKASAPVFTTQSIEVVPTQDSRFEIPSGLNGTFAPAGQIKNINEYIKPSKGSVVEVSITWKDRIINTYHFDSKQVVTVGSHPKNTIQLPVFDSRVSHPLLKIDTQVRVFITSDMNGDVQINDQTASISELIVKGKIPREGVGYSIGLEQGSVIRVELGSAVVAHIRYVAPVPKPLAAPFFYLTTAEVSTLVASFLVFGLMFLYFSIYSPDPVEQIQEQEVQRVAKFIYERPKQRIEVTEAVPEQAKTTAQPIKDQEKAKSRGEEGQASEAMPNKSNSTVKKLTTPNPGTGKGISKAPVNQKTIPDAGSKSQRPDPTKTGLFSVFGSKGTQDQLSQAYSGSAALGGLAGKATGTGGAANVGAGDTPGTGLKDLGAGGEGTATYGIAGVNTKGRGGGLTGYGTGNLGAKPRATIVPGGDGESFTGSIDREAIRKVIRDNQKQIQACYEKTLNKQPGLYGKVILEWVITTNGRVKDARVQSTTLGSSEVENCVLSRLRTWRFPEPPPDQEAVVTFPFLFNAAN
jgi:TonB family protein